MSAGRSRGASSRGSGRVELEARCEEVLVVHGALIELARICRQGSESSWPSPRRSTNGDVWQSTYEKLAIRISDGRVDIARPLRPLALTTARRLLLSEYRRRERLCTLGDTQIHRFDIGQAVQPEEQAEASRKRAVVRARLVQLRREGRLSLEDLAVLEDRYVRERSSAEVASAIGTTPENVRQICTRRRALLRTALAGLELEEAAGGAS